jgi:hypothetical protein
MSTIDELFELVNEIKLTVINPNKDFCATLNLAMSTLDLSADAVARMFDLSTTTINRWVDGTSSPRTQVRDMVLRELKEVTYTAILNCKENLK